MVVFGEEAPDGTWIGMRGGRLVGPGRNAHRLHRNALAVEHAKEVVVGLEEELGRVGEWFVLGKPARLGVAVRAE